MEGRVERAAGAGSAAAMCAALPKMAEVGGAPRAADAPVVLQELRTERAERASREDVKDYSRGPPSNTPKDQQRVPARLRPRGAPEASATHASWPLALSVWAAPAPGETPAGL